MEAADNPDSSPLLSSDASPLKLQVEVTLPRGLGGELTAWRKAFERFASVMERWLENSLAAGVPPSSVDKETGRQGDKEKEASVSLSLSPCLPVSSSTEGRSADMPPTLVDPPTTESAPAMCAPVVEKTALEARAELQAQQGDRYRAAGRKEQALLCYQEALTVDPECAQAYLGRASIYIEQGRLKESLLDCNAALRQQPDRAVLYVLRGLVYQRLGDLKRALDEADEAVRLDPRLPSAYMLRGGVRFKAKLVAEALADVKEAIRLRPNDGRFYGELARLLARTGQHEQAANTYAKVLKLSPDAHAARFHRAVALRQAGDAAGAEAELTEYLRRCPATAASHYQRGLCRLAQRNYAQAVSDFDKAIALKPDDAASYEAKEKALRHWENTARQPRRVGAATAALAATTADTADAIPTRSVATPAKPAAAKTSPAKAKPSPSRPWRSRDDEPRRWLRPAKWACSLVLAGLLIFGGFRLLAGVIYNPYKPDEGPPASATLTTDELFQRFTGNPASAKAELADRYLEVRGPVARHFDDKDPPRVLLAMKRSNAAVNCTLKANLSLHQRMMLSRIEGECQATLVGLCAGRQGNAIALNECRIVKVTKGGSGVRR